MGWYFLHASYEFKPVKFNDLEYSALLLAEDILTKENGFLYEHEIHTGFAKIKASHMQSTNNDNTTTEKFIYAGSKTEIKEIRDKLAVVRQAILKKKRILIEHSNPVKKEMTEREVDPYNLIYREASWYIIGHCHLREQIRTFKLARIRKITVLPESFTIPNNFSISAYMRDTFNVIKGKEYNVEVEFYHPASAWVSEKLWLPSQQIIKINENKIVLKAKVNGLEEIKRWIMGYGRLARVIKPMELAEEIKDELNAMQAVYVSKA